MGAGIAELRRRAVAALALVGVVVASAACGGGPAASARPTDPHLLAVAAVRTTAALPTLRLHAEVASTMNMNGLGGDVNAGPMRMTMTFDADVDLANRQFAGREAMSFTGGPGGVQPGFGGQTVDLIATTTGMFMRQGGAGRWMKASADGLGAAPTNEAIAVALVALLDDPAATYEKADETACSLGTCDHLIVHVPGQLLERLLGPLAGAPQGAMPAGMIPNLDLDVRVDQATLVISEMRVSMTVQGTTTDLFVSVTNPGGDVQIVAPAPALVDDPGIGGGPAGFGGGQVTTILETVGSEIESPEPLAPVESVSAP